MTRPTQQSSSALSPPPTFSRRLSIEQTYHLANVARRKSLDSSRSGTDLRSRIGHAQVLEAVEHVIRTSPPPSPLRMSTTPASAAPPAKQFSLDSPSTISQAPSPARPEMDEYGFSYDSEYDVDDDDLCLTKTASRRH